MAMMLNNNTNKADGNNNDNNNNNNSSNSSSSGSLISDFEACISISTACLLENYYQNSSINKVEMMVTLIHDNEERNDANKVIG
jgi:hypothetical protein